MEKVLNPMQRKDAKKKYSLGEQIEAQEELENLGRYAVPALIETMNTHPNSAFQALASQRLTINARRRMEESFRKDLTKQRAINKGIADEIENLRGQLLYGQ